MGSKGSRVPKQNGLKGQSSNYSDWARKESSIYSEGFDGQLSI